MVGTCAALLQGHSTGARTGSAGPSHHLVAGSAVSADALARKDRAGFYRTGRSPYAAYAHRHHTAYRGELADLHLGDRARSIAAGQSWLLHESADQRAAGFRFSARAIARHPVVLRFACGRRRHLSDTIQWKNAGTCPDSRLDFRLLWPAAQDRPRGRAHRIAYRNRAARAAVGRVFVVAFRPRRQCFCSAIAHDGRVASRGRHRHRNAAAVVFQCRAAIAAVDHWVPSIHRAEPAISAGGGVFRRAVYGETPVQFRVYLGRAGGVHGQCLAAVKGDGT